MKKRWSFWVGLNCIGLLSDDPRIEQLELLGLRLTFEPNGNWLLHLNLLLIILHFGRGCER